MSQKITLSISGMHCASCAVLVREALQSVPSVSAAHVNLATEKANIQIDLPPTGTLKTALLDAVKSVGYKAEIQDKPDPGKDKRRRQDEISNLEKIVKIAGIASLPFLLFMIMDFVPHVSKYYIWQYAGILSIIIATPVQLILGYRFYKGMFAALRVKTLNMDSLIAIGTSVAYGVSVWNYISYTYSISSLIPPLGLKVPELYFETSVFLITFVLFGKWLEARTKGKTTDAIESLVDLQPKMARVKRGTEIIDIPSSEVLLGDLVIVRNGEKAPVDGTLQEGTDVTLDESMLTGESMPVEKKIGDTLHAGTILTSGSAIMSATQIGENTRLSQIIKYVEEAQGTKAPIQDLADTISSYFVPAVIVIAMITFGVWYFLLGASIGYSIMTFTAVLVIACPCALGLATPTALIVGTGIAAKYGILIKGGEALEKASKIDTIVFDKTGTITQGKPNVSDVVALNGFSENDVLRFAASLEQFSTHPIAHAIFTYVQSQSIPLAQVDNYVTLAGIGVKGQIEGKLCAIVKPSHAMANTAISEELNARLLPMQEMGKTAVVVTVDDSPIGIISVSDHVKDSSKMAIAQLVQSGMNVYMITGDHEKTARSIATECGITNVMSEVLPEDKAEKIRFLQNSGARVAMVGDGINDAPALVTAQLGVAMGTGSDIAIESADCVILNGDIRNVLVAINIAKDTVGKIRQNFFFALFYNVLGIPIAARLFAWAGLILRPELAGIAMALSSVSVVTSSLTLKSFDPLNKNIISRLAPIVMTLLFVFMFYQFARGSVAMDSSMAQSLVTKKVINEAQKSLLQRDLVINYLGKEPKLFVIQKEKLNILPHLEEVANVTGAHMDLGFAEAAMMKQEKLIWGTGSKLKNFFGLPSVVISSVYLPTNTILDFGHFISPGNEKSLTKKIKLKLLAGPEGLPRIFFVIENGNIPPQYKNVVSLTRTNTRLIKKTPRIPLFLGYAEAMMMQKEKLFAKEGDTIDNFFGKDVYIAKILPKTNTVLDHLHFVPQSFFGK